MNMKEGYAKIRLLPDKWIRMADLEGAYDGPILGYVSAARQLREIIEEMDGSIEGYTHVEALNIIASQNNGVVKIVDAIDKFYAAGLSQSSRSNLRAHIQQVLTNEDFKRVSYGVYRKK